MSDSCVLFLGVVIPITLIVFGFIIDA